MLNKQYYVEKAKVEKLIARKNQKTDFYNGIYDRYEYPVLTREFAPVEISVKVTYFLLIRAPSMPSEQEA